MPLLSDPPLYARCTAVSVTVPVLEYCSTRIVDLRQYPGTVPLGTAVVRVSIEGTPAAVLYL